MGRIIGIDLGTTNTCVAVMEGGSATVIPNEVGARTTPSVIAFTRDGAVVGTAARRQAVASPETTLFGVKRLIGRAFSSDVVTEMARSVPYPIVRAPNGDAWVSVDGRSMSPPEVSAHVLRQMKKAAEDYVGEPVTEAVVTVPAYFDDAQRQATKDAGAIAGLHVRAILNEPTAAALAYGVEKQIARGTVAVFDLGGGTFDVSILEIEDGVFTVRATSGDTALGGDDFDRCIVDDLAARLKGETGIDVLADPAAFARLREAAQLAKHELSALSETEVQLPFIGTGADGPAHLQRVLDRAWLESLTAHLVLRLEGPCKRALEDAHMHASAVEQVLLVGGMTRMPAVERKVTEIFGRRPVKGVHPDEVVALGAATHAGVVDGQVDEVILLDVTSHSLGIGIVGDKMSVIIGRNTTIPARARKVFKTTSANQDHVAIEVFQGESVVATDNRALGRFLLGDLPPGAAGAVQVEVCFTLDADGILDVQATEIATGQSTSKKVLASSGLSRADVSRLAALNPQPAERPKAVRTS